MIDQIQKVLDVVTKMNHQAEQMILNKYFIEAEQLLNDIIYICSDYAYAHNNLAILYYQTGNKDEALKHIMKAYQISPNEKVILENLKIIST